MRYWRAFARRVENHRLVMDVGLLVIVRGLAWFDGGAVAARAAEIVSGGVVAASARRWVHRRVPRSRADEAYARVLLRWSFARERLTVAADEPAAHSATVATPIAVLLAFAAILTVMDFLPSAPPTGALPLVRGAGVIASASGGDSIQASLPGRFRYMAVEGPAGVTREQFLAAEVHFLRRLGWSHLQSDVFVALSGVPKPVAITTPGADVELDSPHGSVYSCDVRGGKPTGRFAAAERFTPLRERHSRQGARQSQTHAHHPARHGSPYMNADPASPLPLSSPSGTVRVGLRGPAIPVVRRGVR